MALYMCLPKRIKMAMLGINKPSGKQAFWLLLCLITWTFGGQAATAQELNPDFIRGKVLLEEGDYAGAIASLGAALSADRGLDEAYLMRARAYEAMKDLQAAEKDLRTLSERDPGAASYELARLYARNGRDTLAVEQLRIHLTGPGKKPRKEIMTDPAFSGLERTRLWVSLWKTDWYSEQDALLAEAAYLYQNSRYAEALSRLDQAIDQGASSTRAYLLRAHCNEQLSANRAAAEDYTTAVLRGGPDAGMFRERGMFYFRTGKYAEARSDLNRAIATDPNDISLLPDRARILAAMGDAELAGRDYDQYLQYRGNDTEVIHQAGRAMLVAGMTLKALEYFNRNLALDRSKPEFFIDRGDAYLASRTWKYAYEDYSQALDLDPTDGSVYLSRGRARLGMGDREGACYDWNKALHYGEKQAVPFLQQYCQQAGNQNP